MSKEMATKKLALTLGSLVAGHVMGRIRQECFLLDVDLEYSCAGNALVRYFNLALKGEKKRVAAAVGKIDDVFEEVKAIVEG